jgi:O-antigen/teichoic acid export membrane protein
VLSRGLAGWFYRKSAYLCIGLPNSGLEGKYSLKFAKQLFQFGGWFTVTSIIGPLMVQADRFFVGAMISTASITIYVIPYEVTVQSLILVGAITSVAFPAISRMLIADPVAAKALFRKWLIRVVLMMAFGMGILAYILPELLRLWLGREIDSESSAVGQILTIGVFFNAIGSMYFALLHAKGYSKNTAILHLFEAPVYFIILIFFIKYYGVIGCAIAWSLRNVLDAIVLTLMGQKLVLDK